MLDHLGVFGSDTWEHLTGRCRTVAIVGNGEVDADSTSEIQNADFVVRFNNWSNRVGIDQTHRGTRCDLLVANFDCLPERERPPPAAVMHAIPPPFRLRRNAKLGELYYPRSLHLMVNPFWQTELCDELDLGVGTQLDGYQHPLPTVGFTFIWHLNKSLKTRSQLFYVAGFDWRYDATTGKYDKQLPGSPVPKNWTHYYLKEATWITKNMMRPEWFYSKRATAALAPLLAIQ